ncbi:MAG: hypothetical protein H0T46_05595 [Deltaproteobacteria bacterium]|nr:hypothetical protein [Deltaproteobacteria bacterium]
MANHLGPRRTMIIGRALTALGFVLCAMMATSHADARKRVVILDIADPGGAKVSAAIAQVIRRTHTIVSTRDWNRTAKELAASTTAPRSLKKVATKLRIDAIVETSIEKRRGRYVIRIKLHDGANGAYVGQMKTTSPRLGLDRAAQKDVKNELVYEISTLRSRENEQANEVARAGSKRPTARSQAKRSKK